MYLQYLVLDKVKDFLPKIAQANCVLQEKIDLLGERNILIDNDIQSFDDRKDLDDNLEVKSVNNFFEILN